MTFKFTAGADPEVFVRKDGQFVSAHGLVPGTKDNPHPVKDGAVQVDGMALEFNINPAADEDSFVYNMHSVMRQLAEMVPDFEIVPAPVAEFDPEYIKAQPLEARILGCSADYNAWTGQENKPPNPEVPFRTAAAHVHLGYLPDGTSEGEQHEAAIPLIKQLDFYLGLPSLMADPDVKRRELYGQAGAYRPKPYGCEYRVLSNFWLKSEDLMRWLYRNVSLAINSMDRQLVEEYGDIQHIINTSDVASARSICNEAGIPCPEVA